MSIFGWRVEALSKTLNYSLLLLRSSKSMQQKVCLGLDAESQKALEDKLRTVPFFDLSKLRALKNQILACGTENIAAVQSEVKTAKVTCETTERAVNYIVCSTVFGICGKDEAASYFEELPKTSQEMIFHYLEAQEVVNER